MLAYTLSRRQRVQKWTRRRNITILESSEPVSKISVAVRTLTAGGFILIAADRKPGYTLLQMTKYDEFGNVEPYCFALAEAELGEKQVDAAKIAANHYKAHLVVIGSSHVEIPQIGWDRFVNLFGGPIIDLTPFEDRFADNLMKLAFNEVPDNLQGRADELFEIYVHSALQFVFGGRVQRYGQARRFENKPDGIAVPTLGFTALYDAKSARSGFVVTADTMRQCKSYVDDFNSRYANFYRLNCLILISGKFQQRTPTLNGRSQELLASCGVPLSFMNVGTLNEIVDKLKEKLPARRSINWARVFTKPVPRPEDVDAELQIIEKDGLVGK